MKFHTLTIPLTLTLLPLARAQGPQGIQTTTTPTNAPVEPTKVWVPSTLPNGHVTKVISIYTQRFTSTWSELRTPSTGVIGLGTLTGSVGVVKTAVANAAIGRSRAEGGAVKEAWVFEMEGIGWDGNSRGVLVIKVIGSLFRLIGFFFCSLFLSPFLLPIIDLDFVFSLSKERDVGIQ
ncbi:hypothetical protein C7212DRAFT_352545 [Tuber magnatum]|uniref:Uncharacterized protein n=1 Tax=Tuber magnatum TaxID=42249 RepID=A0A317SV73_9PEZI|nr:hypothetical protein C7212DRAFT_352545 [Tuber magnatum]